MRTSRTIALWALLALPGCAWITQNQAARADYARQVEIAALRSAELEDQVAAMHARIAELEETVTLHGRNETERLATLEEVNDEIARLRGDVEKLAFQVGEMQKYLDGDAIARERRTLHAEKRLTAIEKFLHVPTPPPPTDAEMGLAPTDGAAAATPTVPADGTPATAPPETAPAAIAPPATADEALERAVAEMKDGRQAVARVLLQKALTDFPKAPEEPEILYRIGETYLNESDFKPAAKQFDTVVKSFPKSAWAPWAMLRQGEAFEGLGKAEAARLFYQGVVDTYPKTDAAAEAKKRLK